MPPQCPMDAPAVDRNGHRIRGCSSSGPVFPTSSSMPPKACRRARKNNDSGSGSFSGTSRLLRMASMELEVLRSAPSPPAARGATTSLTENLRPFPPACRQLLFGIEGNSRCVDCGHLNPDWASVSYGALLCLGCSGHHRNLGVKTSFVRSVSMDHWSRSQILCMLEGGNHQLSQFFARHHLPAAHSGASTHRYRTVAARFYREKLAEHASVVGGRGEYRGREHARKGAAASGQSPSLVKSPPRGEKPRSSSAPRLEKLEEGRAVESTLLSASCPSAPRVRSSSPNIVDEEAQRKRGRQSLCRSMTE